MVNGDARAAEPGRTWPQQVQQDLIRLGQVEWRMRTSTAKQCPARAASAGIVLDYIGAYDEADRAYVREQAGLKELPQVLSAVAGGPADAAGIRAGDEIFAIDGKTVRDLLAETSDPALLADDIQDRIAADTPGRDAALLIRRNGRLMPFRIRLESVCSARFILKSGNSIEAYSDGENIAITTGTVRFTINDDELALVTGHELAHVIAFGGEPASLFGRRKMEDEADLLGARLAHCAGYDVVRSLGFWERFARRDRFGWLRSPTHRSPEARRRQLSEAAAGLTCSESR